MADFDVADDDDDSWDDYETGPFCEHYGSPYDCGELCKCGHKCCEHWDGAECQVEGCKCEKFVDKEGGEDDG